RLLVEEDARRVLHPSEARGRLYERELLVRVRPDEPLEELRHAQRPSVIVQALVAVFRVEVVGEARAAETSRVEHRELGRADDHAVDGNLRVLAPAREPRAVL